MASKTGYNFKKLQKIGSQAITLLGLIATLPYFRFYHLNTHQPLCNLVRSSTEMEATERLKDLLKRKHNEAQYVQVAGAIMFTSVISCLSWSTLDGVHWSGPALWYASIVLSVSSVVIGAQQNVLVSSQKISSVYTLKKRMSSDLGTLEAEPKRLILFAWQVPVMLLSYSMVTFLGGLSSVVLSPWALNVQWGPSAKTALIFILSMVIGALCFFLGSFAIYNALEEDSKENVVTRP